MAIAKATFHFQIFFGFFKILFQNYVFQANKSNVNSSHDFFDFVYISFKRAEKLYADVNVALLFGWREFYRLMDVVLS